MPNKPDDPRKGLRFETKQIVSGEWQWYFVGAEGTICESSTVFGSDKEARSNIAANKGRLGNAKRAKVVTLSAEDKLIQPTGS